MTTVSRIDKIIGLFCRISSLVWASFAKETYNLIDPASQSHPIGDIDTQRKTHIDTDRHTDTKVE